MVTHKIKGILDYVHTDVWVSLQITSLGGNIYFVSSIGDCSRKVWMYFMWHKLETFAKFKLWKTEVENQTWRKIKCLKSQIMVQGT